MKLDKGKFLNEIFDHLLLLCAVDKICNKRKIKVIKMKANMQYI